jgi:hypothetical protein
MKRIYTLLGAVLLASASQAQMAVSKPSSDEITLSRTRSAASQSSENRGGSTSFFCEDFANGFTGNNGYGAWTFDDSGTTDIWMMATAASPAGAYSSNLDPMASPSAANGWVIFDADLYQGGAITTANPAENLSGWLQTPELDMSSLENVKVDFHQYFRYCCAQVSPLTVEVSIDGGTTWTAFNATGIIVTSANSLSANTLNTVLDISCVAALEPSVYVRWGYNTAIESPYSHYFWGLDDICIYESAIENDLEITQVTNGDILNLWEYKSTPLEQATTSADGGLTAGVIWRNNGRVDQTNCNIVIEILDAADAVLYTGNVPAFDMPAPANELVCPAPVLDTIFFQTGWVPTSVGDYKVRATITSDQTDDLPDNNTLTRLIDYTLDEYGHDDTATDVEIRPRVNADNADIVDPFGVGNYYTVPNDGSLAYGLTVQFGDNTDGAVPGTLGVEFLAALYTDQSTAQGQSFQLEASEYYEVFDEWVNAGPIYFPFDDNVALEVGTTYMVAVQNEDESTTEVTVLAQANSDNDNSTLRQDYNSTQVLTWFGRQSWSPSVRLIVSERVGIDEIAANGLNSLAIGPNPAVSSTRVSIDMKAAANVAYEIRDINGKLITFNNLGRFAQGTGNFEINVANIASGSYILGVVVDGKYMTREKLVIAH